MRTVLITNGNMLSLLSLGEFLRRFHQCIGAVFVTTRLPSQKSNVLGVLRMWRSSGRAYTHFKLLTNVLLPRKLRRRGLPVGVTDFLQHLGAQAQVHYTADINRPEIVEQVSSFKPEILLSFSATMRFCDALVETASRAAVNAHYALLPGYAGLSPYFWYLRNREPECGVTLHRIISKLDAGPIIEQRRFSMQHHQTVFSVLLAQAANISPMLLHFYEGASSERDARSQDLSRRTYFRHPTRADVAELFRHGHRFYTRADLERVERRLKQLVSGGGADALDPP
jgi:methionyl-tRNA formyltransferase